jgi:hypothetical protein
LLNENEWREVSAMMKLGYARVSTNEQDTAAQVAALKSAGCEKIFRDKASGGRWDTNSPEKGLVVLFVVVGGVTFFVVKKRMLWCDNLKVCSTQYFDALQFTHYRQREPQKEDKPEDR